jgi:tetratricopeptide (TPR) repeat protein
MKKLIQLLVSSAPEEWAKTGRRLFSSGRYRQAKLCFERADQHLERAISHAYHLRQDARLIEHGSKLRKETFLSAANIFWASAPKLDPPHHLRCFMRSAECYAEANCLLRASDVYYRAENWTLAARCARMAGAFDRAVEIIRERDVDKAVAESIIQVCKVVYVQRNDVEYVVAISSMLQTESRIGKLGLSSHLMRSSLNIWMITTLRRHALWKALGTTWTLVKRGPPREILSERSTCSFKVVITTLPLNAFATLCGNNFLMGRR